MLPPLSTFPSRPSRGFTGRELRGQFQGRGASYLGSGTSSFNKMCVEVDIGVERGKARSWIVVLEAQRTFVELRWKWGWIKTQIWKLETKRVKRVFPASFGRPDNSWPAAKTVARSNFTGAGHVTWLLLTTNAMIPILELMYGHT